MRSSPTLQELLRKLTLREYIGLFGSVFDKKTRRTKPFVLWPKQARLCDLMEKTQECLIPKARQLGISEITAEEGVKKALQSSRTIVLIFSKTDRDALEYLETKIKPKLAALPKIQGILWPTVERESLRHVKLSNGSRIVCLPASNRAGASFVADHVIFDEAGGIDLQPGVSMSIMYRNVFPTLEKAGGAMRILGTSEPGSYFNQIVREAMDGTKPIDCYFLPADADPNRTTEWLERTKAKYPTLADFQSQYPLDIKDFFAVREGLIYPQFDPAEAGPHVREFEPDVKWPLYASYDHGYRHAAALLEVYHDPLKDVLYVRNELVWREVHAEHIAADIVNRYNELPRLPYMEIADSAIFAETGVKGPIEVFKSKGLHRFVRSVKHRAKSGLDWSAADISQRLTERRLVIHPSCDNLLREMTSWRWDETLRNEKPVDKDNDCIDALRYVCAAVNTKRTEPKPPPPAMGYRKAPVRKKRTATWLSL
jgi:hypothetical protein